jgi:DNA-binding beta-propeller fold protein YncE
MRHFLPVVLGTLAAFTFQADTARAEILAMVNYESNAEQATRKEGIAILDVDPASANFGKIVEDIALPADLHNHHIFYNKDSSKAYLTALSAGKLMVFDLKSRPYELKTISVPDCEVGEDMVFSGDNARWFLTCMGSSTVIVGDAVSDKAIQTIRTSKPYPHGIAIHDGIDRILITGTIKHDLTEPGETITAIEASTGKVLNSHKVSTKPSSSGVAPVEVLFVPGTNPPVAYVTNMFGASLWAATWDPKKEDFVVGEAVDLGPVNGNVPLEMYFNKAGDRFYLTTAIPGQFHVFEVGDDVMHPKHLGAIPAAGGAHHVAFTKDGKYAFVQNNLLGLPDMNEGSITVIDMKTQTALSRIDTFKEQGLNPNLIVLLPEWNDPAGH